MEREGPKARQWAPIRDSKPEFHSLRYWSSCLNSLWRQTFERRYGYLLQLIEIDIQPAAIEALVQYYDSPMRCFTFRDFQLAPTLEEYERLLGLPLDKSPQYFHQGQQAFRDEMATLLKLPESAMEKLRQNAMAYQV